MSIELSSVDRSAIAPSSIADVSSGGPSPERSREGLVLRARELSERIAIAGDVLRVERAFGLEPGRLADVETRCRSAAQDLDRLEHVEMRLEDAHHLLDRLETQILEAEGALIEVDARVSPNLFVRLFGRTYRDLAADEDGLPRARVSLELTPTLLSRYARFLTAHFDGGSARIDRVTRLVDRLVFVAGEDGELLARPWKEVRALLEFVAEPAGEVTRSVVDAALAFFAAAHARVADLSLVDELFEGGYFLDFVGYQLSLGPALFEPRVLYASAVLNATVAKKVAELARLEGIELESVKERMFAAHLQAAATFDAGGGEEPEVISTRVAETAPSSSARTRGWEAPQVGALGRTLAVIIAILFVAMAVGAFRRSTRNANELPPLSKVELEKVSPALIEGAFSRGESDTVFVGHLSHSEWSSQPRAARRGFARTLLAELMSRGVQSALVYDDDVVVVELLHGQIVFVE